METGYFEQKQGPEPLRMTIQRRVRFEEVDPLGIVWHGRYPGFFEEGRMALSERYGIGYLDLHAHGVVTPVKKMHVDYVRPLRFAEEFSLETLHHYSEAARINYEFIIRNQKGEIATNGYTVQLFMDLQGNLLVLNPDFYAEFLRQWREGELANP